MSGRTPTPRLVAVKGEFDGEVLPPAQPPTRPPTPRISLRDIDAIRREMGRVYRDARRGRIQSSEAARFVYILAELRKTYEASALERRLTVLEGDHGEHP